MLCFVVKCLSKLREDTMTTVNLPDDLVEKAKHYAAIYNRSTPKQIEYWAKIGKIAEENPDLPYDFIKDILLALQQAENGETEPYKFGWHEGK